MNITIFSKDRACQLHLMLKTLKNLFKEYASNKVNVVYKYKNNEHAAGYDILKGHYPEVNFICENTTNECFRALVLKTIDTQEKHTVFFVDDNVVKMPFSTNDKEFKALEENDKILCLSLRMNNGMSYCHPARLHYTRVPQLQNNIWEWRGHEGDWGYPMSVDGHVFRTNEILSILHRFDFSNPTNLENNMSMNTLSGDYMICYDKSIVFNNPLNRVHTLNNTPHANVSEDMLLGEYRAGKRLYLNCNIGEVNFTSPHFDIPIGLT